MPKKIILLSDGTGNSAGKFWKTNVWRLYKALDLSDKKQLVYYQDGVGTSAFKPLAILGGAFGWGLKRNVLDLYMFLCRNYKWKEEQKEDQEKKDNDQIYCFGFSRGAFTIRILLGLIKHQGLVRASTEEELKRLAQIAYCHYRKKYPANTLVSQYRRLRKQSLDYSEKLRGQEAYTPEEEEKKPQITFVGL